MRVGGFCRCCVRLARTGWGGNRGGPRPKGEEAGTAVQEAMLPRTGGVCRVSGVGLTGLGAGWAKGEVKEVGRGVWPEQLQEWSFLFLRKRHRGKEHRFVGEWVGVNKI